MIPTRRGRTALVAAVVLTLGAAPDQTPIELLEGHGLKVEGKYLLLPKAEDQVKAELNKVLPVLETVETLYVVWAEHEQLKGRIQYLNDESIATDERIREIHVAQSRPMQGNDSEKKARAEYLAELRRQTLVYQAQVREDLEKCKSRRATPKEEREHAQKFQVARTSFLESYADLKKVYGGVRAAYDAVSKNAEVKQTVGVLRASKKIDFKYGPSEVVVRGWTRAYKAEQNLTGKPIDTTTKKKKPTKADKPASKPSRP